MTRLGSGRRGNFRRRAVVSESSNSSIRSLGASGSPARSRWQVAVICSDGGRVDPTTCFLRTSVFVLLALIGQHDLGAHAPLHPGVLAGGGRRHVAPGWGKIALS